jgi:DGQHR domain-containing protein
MKVIKVKKYGREYLKLNIIPVVQKKHKFYITIFPAKDFLHLYTVEPTEYRVITATAFAEKFKDDESYLKHNIAIDKERLDRKPFERLKNTGRINAIRDWLNKEEYAFFPNTIIVACDLINHQLDDGFNIKFAKIKNTQDIFDAMPNLAFLEEDDKETNLYIPNIQGSLLVIDGQHRIEGLKISEVADSYGLLVSFILGYDKSVLAKLFYTINYEQKPVNRSVLYHLSGEFSLELTEIKFMHEVVKILNEFKNSPFYRRIKMLGVIPEDTPEGKRKKVTVSQAFLIDYLKPTITEKNKERSIYPPIFLHYYKKEKDQIEIIRFLIKYFDAIRSLVPKGWDDPQNNIISKTIGVGALIRVLHYFFTKMFIEEFKSDPSKIKTIRTAELKTKLKGIEKIDFSKTGPFGEIGGAAGLNALKEKIIEQCTYFEKKSYARFIEIYTKAYLDKFRKWLQKYT